MSLSRAEPREQPSRSQKMNNTTATAQKSFFACKVAPHGAGEVLSHMAS